MVGGEYSRNHKEVVRITLTVVSCRVDSAKIKVGIAGGFLQSSNELRHPPTFSLKPLGTEK